MSIDNRTIKNLLVKVASHLNETGPRLEKLAGFEESHEKTARQVVDRLVEYGLLDVHSKQAALQEIIEGGTSKLAEVVDFTITKASLPALGAPSTEKVSSNTETLSSDDIWNRGFDLYNLGDK